MCERDEGIGFFGYLQNAGEPERRDADIAAVA